MEKAPNQKLLNNIPYISLTPTNNSAESFKQVLMLENIINYALYQRQKTAEMN